MRRPPVLHHAAGISMVRMGILVAVLLVGFVTGNQSGHLRATSQTLTPSPTPRRTQLHSPSPAPGEYDFSSLKAKGTSSQANKLMEDVVGSTTAGTLPLDNSELERRVDITTTPSGTEVPKTFSAPSTPTPKPSLSIKDDLSKIPTPAPTNEGKESGSTRRPTTSTPQSPAVTPSAVTTSHPSAESTSPPFSRSSATPRTSRTSTVVFTRTPSLPATTATPSSKVVSTTRPVFTSIPSREVNFEPDTTNTLPSSSEPPITRNADTTVSETVAPQSATPQAIKGSNLTSTKSKWSLMIIVGSIATVAVVGALLIWRDTRRVRRQASVSETLPAPSKNTSCELDFDRYPPSPSLTSGHQSVDTFMGRLPPRKESEANVSSRAASTADLLNVSSIGNRSTRSDPSSRSQTIHEHEEDRDNDSGTLDDEGASRPSRSDRTNSDPPVSFDENVHVLSDWEGSDCERSHSDSTSSDIDADTSVERIFEQHRRAFLQAQGMGPPEDRTSNLLATWTSSLPRPYALSAHRNMTSSPVRFANEFKFEEDESKSEDDRDSNGSAYSAVPAILEEEGSMMMSSFSSGWSTVTGVSGEGDDEARGSDRSIGTYDEEL